MMSRLFKLFVVVMLAASPVLAQAKAKPAEKSGDQKTIDQKAADTQAKAAASAAAASAATARPEPSANIRVELAISDQRGTSVPISKIVTMTMMDSGSGRIRTGGDVRTPLGFRPVTLNVDAQPRIHKDGKIRVDMTIEYRPTAAESDTEQSSTPTINESISVLLEDGKPLLISQSADPATDRKVKIEVKATILK
jgi:hypothetical protein